MCRLQTASLWVPAAQHSTTAVRSTRLFVYCSAQGCYTAACNTRTGVTDGYMSFLRVLVIFTQRALSSKQSLSRADTTGMQVCGSHEAAEVVLKLNYCFTRRRSVHCCPYFYFDQAHPTLCNAGKAVHNAQRSQTNCCCCCCCCCCDNCFCCCWPLLT
jgi:hypothetical protein